MAKHTLFADDDSDAAVVGEVCIYRCARSGRDLPSQPEDLLCLLARSKGGFGIVRIARRDGRGRANLLTLTRLNCIVFDELPGGE